jgi:hypothetical protein
VRDDTDWHMHYPATGDRFAEFANVYIKVIDVGSDGVIVEEHLPRQRRRYFTSVEQFRRAYQRSTGWGYVVRYEGREQ